MNEEIRKQEQEIERLERELALRLLERARDKNNGEEIPNDSRKSVSGDDFNRNARWN